MLLLPLLLVFLTHPIRPSHVTNIPFAAKLDKFYEKLEKLTVSPPKKTDLSDLTSQWYLKLEKLNALTPDSVFLSDDDEEVLSAIQAWGGLNADQIDGVAKELQRIRERDEDRSERIADDYADIDDNDEEYVEPDYHNDAKEYEDEEDPDSTSPQAPPSVTPAAFTREEPQYRVISAVDPIAATNERPRILDDSSLTALDRSALRHEALMNMKRVVRAGKCLVPQPRWLTVKQLAPAADIVYMPPWVELHRCAHDSGCCNSEAEVCAPVDGTYVVLPFYLHKADGNISIARMLFYNHTRCTCVSRATLQASAPVETRALNDWRPPTAPPTAAPTTAPTDAPSVDSDEDSTAPPQLRRCTCPTLFLGSVQKDHCVCACDWRELVRRRECQSLARGREHFGLRDRVCIAQGNCAAPSCEYGAYDRAAGRCPLRNYRRIRYRTRTRYHHATTD